MKSLLRPRDDSSEGVSNFLLRSSGEEAGERESDPDLPSGRAITGSLPIFMSREDD